MYHQHEDGQLCTTCGCDYKYHHVLRGGGDEECNRCRRCRYFTCAADGASVIDSLEGEPDYAELQRRLLILAETLQKSPLGTASALPYTSACREAADAIEALQRQCKDLEGLLTICKESPRAQDEETIDDLQMQVEALQRKTVPSKEQIEEAAMGHLRPQSFKAGAQFVIDSLEGKQK